MLSACAAPPILPAHAADQKYTEALVLPRRVLVTELIEGKPADQAILVVQQEVAGILRWTLLDALGLPLARQLLKGGMWHNDGLLPPNAQARVLFAALLFAWTPRAELTQRYPDNSWEELTGEDGQRTRTLHRQNKNYVTITWQMERAAARTFTIDTTNGKRWHISPLTETS